MSARFSWNQRNTGGHRPPLQENLAALPSGCPLRFGIPIPGNSELKLTPSMRFTLMLGLAFATVMHSSGIGTPSTLAVPSDPEIRKILIERIDKYRQSVGIVVGVIGPQGRRVIAYGKLAAGDPRPLNGDTVFEIGSITKVFTSLLLADMVERGEVTLTDPVAKYLPAQVRIPGRNGEQIRLQDLATHTSGLPRMPSNLQPEDASNPFADYSVSRLYEFLSSYQLPRDIGSRFEYSNLGGALLGHTLAQRAGMDYGQLVESRIAGLLRMKSTRIDVTPEMKARFAVGHAYALEPTPNWDLGAFAGAGALHSTANDLLTFLAAHLGYTRSPLAPAMASMQSVRRESGLRKVALGWFVDTHDGVEILWHDGGTGGYRSFVGYDPRSRVGVVVLSNNGTGAGVEDLGIHLLNPKLPLLDSETLTPPKQRTEILVDSRLLDTYTGRYRFPSSQFASVTREDGHLFLQGDGDVKVAFYAESEHDFFARIMDAQITFKTDPEGRVTELIFHRDGSSQRVQRVE
jgi:serine-type D-Ala-D-Ala carboxypeptidase/endopeptidase